MNDKQADELIWLRLAEKAAGLARAGDQEMKHHELGGYLYQSAKTMRDACRRASCVCAARAHEAANGDWQAGRTAT